MSTTRTTTVVTRPRRRAVPARAVVVTRAVRTTRPQPRRVRRRRNRLNRQPAHSHLANTCLAMRNPICCPPVKLPTSSPSNSFLARATYRGTFFVPADGSMSVAAVPTLGQPDFALYINSTNSASAAAWAGYGYNNGALIMNASSQARILGLGIKMTTQVPATASPGFIYSASLPVSRLFITGTAAGVLSTSSSFRSGPGNKGAYAVSRPIDTDAFNFALTSINPPPIATSDFHPDWTVPIIVAQGLPVASVVLIEVFLNLECLPQYNAANAIEASPDSLVETVGPTYEPNTLLRAANAALTVASGTLDQLAQLTHQTAGALVPRPTPPRLPSNDDGRLEPDYGD